MSNSSYRPLSLNLDPTEPGGLMRAITTMEPRQIDRQSDTTSLQDRTSFIASSSNGATDRESNFGIQATVYPRVHQKIKAPRPVYQKFWGPWGWEIVAFVAAISLSAATVIVLSKYDGEIQPQWSYNVTLGAVTALLATIIRSVLLIILEEVIGHSRWSWFQVPRPLYQFEILDHASRGPWGSLNYLTRLHRLHSSTIAAKPWINTFTQQAIQSVACVKADSTTEAWTAQIIYNEGGDAVLPNINIAATEAIFQGRGTDNRQSSFYCPSGNCTFGATEETVYSSLGVCSKYVNISPAMDYVITNHTPVITYNIIALITSTSINNDTFAMSGLRANKDFYCQWPKHNRTTDVQLGPNTQVGSFDYPTFSTRFGMITAIILSGIACNIPGQRNDGPTSLRNKSSQIYSVCWLYPCIKYYNGFVSDRRLQETIIKTDLLSLQTKQSSQANQEDWYEFGVYGSYVDQCYINGKRVNHSQTPPIFTGNNYAPNNSQSSDLDCWYGFTGSFPKIITQQSLSYGPTNWDGAVPSMLGEYWLKYLLGFPWYLQSDFMGPLDTISTGIDNVATTMTNVLREIGNNSHGGATIILATVYILVHTKSSILPLLYYGLEKEAQKGELETELNLSHDAKQRQVCLRRDIKGDWGLDSSTTVPPSDSSTL
ncbi:hypothetical protein F4803DRAFT_567453 [Xylaria telfairii]|nr:hypothetical protein F4803DRAFT_567453 [Xylaria telfairii]